MNWDSAKEGELVLDCSIFVPYHFEGYQVVDIGTASTNPVTWTEDADTSTNLALPITIGAVLAIGIFAFIARRNMVA